MDGFFSRQFGALGGAAHCGARGRAVVGAVSPAGWPSSRIVPAMTRFAPSSVTRPPPNGAEQVSKGVRHMGQSCGERRAAQLENAERNTDQE